MAAQPSFPQSARDLGYLPFIHFTTDELHEAMFLIADAARGLRAVVVMLENCRDAEELRPRELAALLEPLYRRIADATELENTGVPQ